MEFLAATAEGEAPQVFKMRLLGRLASRTDDLRRWTLRASQILPLLGYCRAGDDQRGAAAASKWQARLQLSLSAPAPQQTVCRFLLVAAAWPDKTVRCPNEELWLAGPGLSARQTGRQVINRSGLGLHAIHT